MASERVPWSTARHLVRAGRSHVDAEDPIHGNAPAPECVRLRRVRGRVRHYVHEQEAKAVAVEISPAEAVPTRTVITALPASPAVAARELSRVKPVQPVEPIATDRSTARLPDVPVHAEVRAAPPVAATPCNVTVPLTSDLRRLHITVSKRFMEMATPGCIGSGRGGSRDRRDQLGDLEPPARLASLTSTPDGSRAPQRFRRSAPGVPPRLAAVPLRCRFWLGDVRGEVVPPEDGSLLRGVGLSTAPSR